MSHAPVKKVIVLGGGSAGFMAAMALRKRLPMVEVLVIRSRDIGVIGVGEGSTVALTRFLHEYLKVGLKKFHDVAQPTWKMGLKFLWGPRPHFLMTTGALGQYSEGWAPLFVFETTTPNKTFGVGPEVITSGNRPPAPPRPNYVISPGGTVTLTQDLTRVLPNPQLKHPVRLRIYVHEQKTEMSNRVVGMSDWIEYR